MLPAGITSTTTRYTELVLMTDASCQAASYAVLVEDDRNQKYTSTRKTYAPTSYGSKTTHHPKSKCPSTRKNF